MVTHTPEGCSPYAFPGTGEHFLSIKEIAEIVCKELHIDVSQLMIKCRKTEIRRPRQILMHLLYWYGWGPSAISRFFIHFDHATVSHSYKVILNDQLTDKDLKTTISNLYSIIKK